jgi:geranylgeranyl pyrophosphate synthase
MLDVELGLSENPSLEEIMQKTYLKTANYSVSRPMQVGLAINNNLSPKNSEFCLEFGFNLGLSFQIQDDYLNLAYSLEVTGKEQYGDLYENKHTLASWFLKEKNIAMKFTRSDLEAIPKYLLQSGVLAYLTANIEDYYLKALAELEANPEFETLKYLVQYLQNRIK